MFFKTCKRARNWIGMGADEAGKDCKRSSRLANVLTTALTVVLLLTASGPAHSEAIMKNDFAFVNAVDATQGFSSFGSTPAINNAGAVAFEAVGSGFALGSVWKWHNGRLTPIATSANGTLGAFGETVVINASGRVGFSAKVLSANDRIIATGDGSELTKIASANEQGLVGGQFLGISAINERGTVVFLGLRKGSSSQAIFAGGGGTLTAIIDTATDSSFSALGNSDIDSSSKIVFRGFLADGTEGIFLSDHGIKDITDTTNPNFGGFLDPVINDNGTVGSSAFLNAGGVEVFTANASGISPRTNPNSSFFTSVDNVSINNSGDVAFFATEAVGGEGIFVEFTGHSNAVPVIETGDPLFGSTVVALGVGRFSLNNRGQIAFQYQLADGRSGIAVASRQN